MVVATSVVVVAVTALAASITHFVDFIRDSGDDLDTVLSIVVFTVPGVIIGGQLGPLLSRRVTEETLLKMLGWLFLVVAALTLGEVALSG